MHILSNCQAENTGLHKHAQPELKKCVLIKKVYLKFNEFLKINAQKCTLFEVFL